MRFLRFLSVRQIAGQTCLLRIDLNTQSAGDSLRLEASLPTIKLLSQKGARIIILSHRGRPRGRNLKLSLKPFLPVLEKKLGLKIKFLPAIPATLPAGKLFLLENLRFWPGEQNNDREFAEKLARLGDFYVNDAFAVCHRPDASVATLPKLLPSYAGLLLEKEVKNLSSVMKNPKRPMALILGGVKVEDKLPVIKNLLPKADSVLLGSTAVKAKAAIPKSPKIKKPVDWIGEEGRILDIGPETVKIYKAEIKKAGTIVWNGPVGRIETPKYARGSEAIAKAIAKSKAFSVAGGGETTQFFIRAISNYQFLISKKRLFLSTGGGAMLDFLAGKKLPGITALK